jgi:DNA transformation protein and related proteins
MAVTAEFIEYLGDLFAVMPDTGIKRMFGGVGIFRHGLMYALAMSDGRIALKADEENVAAFRAEGCEEWTYEMRGGPQKSMNYWYMPERLADDPDEMRQWALAAFDAAMRADARKPPKQRKLKN